MPVFHVINLNIFLFCVSVVKSTNTGTNPDTTNNIINLKHSTEILLDKLEKWNNIFPNSSESHMSPAALSSAKIGSDINNLRGRAHVWDTFQLHISAWNDEMATLDRKADIINKGQEKILDLETKINSISNIDYKIDDMLNKLNNMEELLIFIKKEIQIQREREFATGDILSTVKTIESKLDQSLNSQEIVVRDKNLNSTSKLTIECNTSLVLEDILKDMSSKVDIIFDKISKKEEIEKVYGMEDYLDDRHVISTTSSPNNYGNIEEKISTSLEKILNNISSVENTTISILHKQDESSKYIQKLFRKCSTSDVQLQLHKALSYYFNKQKGFCKYLSNENNDFENNFGVEVIYEANKKGCEDLNYKSKRGIYIFGIKSEINTKNRDYNKRFCIIRKDGIWTVIQRRDNYTEPQNFNSSWSNYKQGFGDLQKDFWFGNDFISKLSTTNNFSLRIELEDFAGNQAWAEYSKFQVLSEEHNYQLIVQGYQGNASDAFSSHNGSYFSTFDKKNDQAPECCPCAISYGGGWWFNSCFECNLNGLYFKKGYSNGYFGGIIWENWLGNYSLKKSVMMVKISKKEKNEPNTFWPYYEDP